MKRLNFKNIVQKALFDIELSGQLSDGMWENTRPYQHWVPWVDAETFVNPEQLGRNFGACKDNYNFNSSQLLECVGYRMLNIANMAENGVPLNVISQADEGVIPHYPDRGNGSTYWSDVRKTIASCFGEGEIGEQNLAEALKGSYDMKKLRKELAEMKKIVRIRF